MNISLSCFAPCKFFYVESSSLNDDLLKLLIKLFFFAFSMAARVSFMAENGLNIIN